MGKSNCQGNPAPADRAWFDVISRSGFVGAYAARLAPRELLVRVQPRNGARRRMSGGAR